MTLDGDISKVAYRFLVEMKGEEIVDVFDSDVIVSVSEEEDTLYFSWTIGRIGLEEAVEHHGKPDPLFDEDDLTKRSLHWVVTHPREMQTITEELGGKVMFKFRGITFFFNEERNRTMIKCWVSETIEEMEGKDE